MKSKSEWEGHPTVNFSNDNSKVSKSISSAHTKKKMPYIQKVETIAYAYASQELKWAACKAR